MTQENNSHKYIYDVNKYIDKYIKRYNSENEDKIVNYKSISLCTTNNTYSVLQIQPKAKLVVDTEKGLFSQDANYEKRLWDFIEKTFESNYDLVLTPEYSVPLHIIKQLIDNKDRMETGTLYCLCCYGTPYKEFECFLKDCSSSAKVCSVSWDHIGTKGRIVCCLFYITKIKFLTEDSSFDELFVFPQLKIHPMKDTEMGFETAALSCGNKVFYFGKDGEVGFLSIICADVFKSDLILEIKTLLGERKFILFHPQLNSKPHNTYFQQMRNTLISYSQRGHLKILALNWAKGTSFIIDNKEQIGINDSWSAIYEKYDEHYFEDYVKAFEKNAKYGLNIAHDHHIVTFYFSSDDHVIDMNLSRIMDQSIPEDILYTLILSINKCFVYSINENHYVTSEKLLCKKMIDHFFVETEEFDDIINCDKCCTENRLDCRLGTLNKFISSVYNRRINKEFEIINDGNVTSVSAEHYSNIHTKEKIIICKRIHNKLKNKEVTLKFKSYPAKFKFQYHKNGENLFNVKYLTEDSNNGDCRVVYLKYASKCDAEKLFFKMFNANNKTAENLIIYYEDEDGVHIYPDSTDYNIAAPQIVTNNASILGGKTK